MADLRQELTEQSRYGPETYIGQLCARAADEIRRLENENTELRDRMARIRVQSDVSRI